MYKDEAVDFANYEVYEIVGGECHVICVCKEHKMADILTQILASNDKDGDTYYFTSINNPGDLVIGGGWYISYHKGEDGKLHRSSLM